MKWSVGSKLAAGFGIAVLIFTIVGIVAYQGTTALIEAARWRQHTYDVLVNVSELGSLLRELELAQRNYLLLSQDRYLESYRAVPTRIKQALGELRRLTSDNASQQRRLEQIESLVQRRIAAADETLEVRRTSSLQAAIEYILRGKGTALSNEIGQVLAQMQDEENQLLERRSEVADSTARNARLTILWGTLIALACAALAGWIITRDIATPLRHLTGLADRAVVGDLSGAPLPNKRSDEVGVLGLAFERMTQFLRSIARAAEQIAAGDLRTDVTPQSDRDVLGHAFLRMTGNLREQLSGLAQGTAVLGSSSGQIVASTAQLAAGAAESATAVSQTTTTVAEVRQTAQMANQKAKLVSENAQRAAQSSLSGRVATENLIAAMSRIRDQMQAIAASMMRLSEQGQTIGQIIATVEDLAAQSNLLAVNAAIEAAKAGEQGKGFGVVAQEIKALAEQSRQATDQVRTILGDIQKATAAAVMATEQGSKSVEQGAAQTEGANQAIQALTSSVTEASQAATQIAASSQEQLIGMDQIAAAMESIKGASTQNVASAKQLESAARNLDELGRRLKGMLDRYVVS